MPGPFDDLIPAQKKPAFTGYIPGTPDPYKASAEERAREDQRMQRERDSVSRERDQLSIERDRIKLENEQKRTAATGGIDGTEGENKAASLVTNLQSAMNNIRSVAKVKPEAAQPGLLEIGAGILGPDAREWAQSDERRDIAGSQFIAIDSALTLATGAAYTPSQLEGYARSLFPTLNDSPYNIAAKRRKFEQIIQAGRLQAGAKAPNIDQAIAAVDAIYGPQNTENKKQDLGIVIDPAKANEDGVIINPAPNRPDMTGGVPTGTDVRFGFEGGEQGFDRTAYLADIGLDPNKEATLMAGLNAITGNPELTADDMIKVYADIGAPLPNAADFQQQLEYARKGYRFGPVDSSVAESAYKAKVEAEAAGMDATGGELGISDLAQQGLTVGLGDEAAGVGTALSELLQGNNPIEGYQIGRDAQRLRLEKARDDAGWLGTAAEIAGGGASFGVPVLSGVQTTRQLVNTGALQGALTGFGYGEGTKGSLTGAVVGGGIGAGATGVLVKGADMVASRIGAKAGNQAALDTATAAADEGITIPRAMVDPKKSVRATALDSTLAGRPVINEQMGKVADAVENRVSSLSTGRVVDAENLGNTVRTAAEREIKNSGTAAKRSYDNAERLAGDAKVTPKTALAEVDAAIARLSETSNTNSAEIAYLEGLKKDLSKDLSVGALRDLRTTLRQKISKGDLTFGQNEARVLAVMKSAADDIRTGLSAQGKADAARAFDVADKAYSDRMDFISSTLQKLIGRRQDNLSGEAIAKRFASMRGVGGDAQGLQQFFRKLSTDERDDISATILDAIGKNGKGDFSLAFLAKNINNIPASARRTIFGADGAKSLENLKVIAKAFDSVKRNTSNTGIGNDWRSVLGSAVFGGGIPFAAGSGGGSAVAAGVGLAGAKLTRDYVSAKMVMSPNFQRWLKKAVTARTPEQIADSFKSLRRVAATEPAIGGEVNALSNYLLQAANDTGPMTAAANSDRKEPSLSNQTAKTAGARQ